MRKYVWTCLLVGCIGLSSIVISFVVPAHDEWVTDQADIFSDGQEQYLEAQLEALEELHKAEIAVLTVSSLEGEDIAQVGYQVASTRGIGKDESANGMLLLIAPNERERGIDVGYGLEGDVPDITAFQLGRTYLVPAFREQKYFDGVSSLVTALSGTVAGTYNPELYSTGNDVSTFDNFLMGFIILLFLGFFVGTFTRSAIDAEHASMAGGMKKNIFQIGSLLNMLPGFFIVGPWGLLYLIPLYFLRKRLITSKHIQISTSSGGFSSGGQSSGGGSFGGGFSGFGGGSFGGGGVSGGW